MIRVNPSGIHTRIHHTQLDVTYLPDIQSSHTKNGHIPLLSPPPLRTRSRERDPRKPQKHHKENVSNTARTTITTHNDNDNNGNDNNPPAPTNSFQQNPRLPHPHNPRRRSPPLPNLLPHPQHASGAQNPPAQTLAPPRSRRPPDTAARPGRSTRVAQVCARGCRGAGCVGRGLRGRVGCC